MAIRIIKAIAILVVIGTSNLALANDGSGVYIYGAAGQAQTANPQSEAFMLFAGYQLNPNWSVEGGYVDLGKLSTSAKSTATSLTVVKLWNVYDMNGKSRFSFLTKFGIAQVKTAPITTPTSPAISKRGATFGVGATYEVDTNWSLRVMGDSLDTGITNEGRVSVASLGLSYKF